MEMEIKGPITTIRSEESVGLMVTWRVFENVQLAAIDDIVDAFMKTIDLEA